MDLQRTLVNLGSEQKAALRELADRRHRSVSAEVRDAIRYYLSIFERDEQGEESSAMSPLSPREEELLESLLGRALEDQKNINETLDETIEDIRSTLQRIEAIEKGGRTKWAG